MPNNCIKCGNIPTNSEDGICASCKVIERVDNKMGEQKQREKSYYCKVQGCDKVTYRKGMCLKHLKSSALPPPDYKSTDAGCDNNTQPATFFAWIKEGINNNYFTLYEDIKMLIRGGK